MRKNFKDLDLSNAFLFAAALEDEETCQLVLEIILGRSIPKVKVHSEHTILYNSNFRSVRLDVYAEDEMQVFYDLEMQNTDERNLAKRSRYYQAEMDVSSLRPGEDFNELKPSCIIYICAFDPFGQGLYRYVFEEYCKDADIPLGDGTQKIFLNTRGTRAVNVSPELIHFLHYVEESTETVAEESGEVSVGRIHERVRQLKRSRELEGSYMRFEELLRDSKKEGKVEDIIELLQEVGEVSEDLRTRIRRQTNMETLSQWLKLAAKADSVEEFESKMQ